MAISLKLYRIDEAPLSREVDVLDGGDDMGISFFVNDIAEIIKSKSDFAKGVKLLGTNRTNHALEWAFRLDVKADNIINKTIPCSLSVDGVLITKVAATLTVQRISTGSDGIVYECTVTGGRYGWASKLEALDYCAIGLDSHVFSPALVSNSLDRTGLVGPAYDDTYIGCAYNPVFYGGWLIPTQISIYDLRPHLYLKHLLEKVFAYIGYSLRGEFVETAIYGKMQVLYANGVFGIPQALYDELWALELANTIASYDPTNINVIYWQSDTIQSRYWDRNVFNVPQDMYAYIAFRLDAGTQQATLAGFCNGGIDFVGAAHDWQILVNATAVATGTYSGTAFLLEWVGEIQAGDEVRIKIDQGAHALPIQICLSGKGVGSLIVRPITGVVNGTTVNLCDSIPTGFSVKQLMDDITLLFGLSYETNEITKEVKWGMLPKKPTIGNKNWTNKVDKKDINLEFDERCGISLKYREDGDDKSFKDNAAKYNLLVADGCSTRELQMLSRTNTIGDKPIVTYYHGSLHHYVINSLLQSTNPSGYQGFSTTAYTHYYGREVVVVELRLVAGLTFNYHWWRIEVNGFPVASAPYIGAAFVVSWSGVLVQGDVVRFRLVNDVSDVSGLADVFLNNLDSTVLVYPKNLLFHFYNAPNPLFRSPMPYMVNYDMETVAVDDITTLGSVLNTRIKHKFGVKLAIYEGLVDAAVINITNVLAEPFFKYYDTALTTFAHFPYAYFWDYVEGIRDSLAFDDMSEYVLSPSGYFTVQKTILGRKKGGMSFYYDVFSGTGYLVYVTCWLRLSVADIQRLDFYDYVYLALTDMGTAKCLLLEVNDWSPSVGMAKCKFIKV
jgi:hypothetical protein